MTRGSFVYITTNKNHTVLYVGVTSNLPRRIHQHIHSFYPGSFTSRYNVNKLVYYEGFHSIRDAIAREKQLKAGSRKRKESLVNNQNPEWRDLYPGILEGNSSSQ